MRKIVQIAFGPTGIPTALCDDGTIWERFPTDWVEIDTTAVVGAASTSANNAPPTTQG